MISADLYARRMMMQAIIQFANAHQGGTLSLCDITENNDGTTTMGFEFRVPIQSTDDSVEKLYVSISSDQPEPKQGVYEWVPCSECGLIVSDYIHSAVAAKNGAGHSFTRRPG